MSVNTAHAKIILSRNCVSQQVISSSGDASQTQWSIILESQNSRSRATPRGGRMIINPDSQQPRRSWLQTVVYDGWIVKGFADGSIVVIRHGSQEEKF